MSSSPRFWQKLGLGKQNKSSSTVNSTDNNKQGNGMSSSISFNNVHEASLDYGEKQVKRFSGSMSLRHRASSASLYQQMTTPPPEKQKRGSYMKPFRRIDPEESNTKFNENTANLVTPYDQKVVSPTRISTDIQRKMSTRKQPIMENTPNRLTPTRLKRTKSNQSLMSIKTPEKTNPSKLRQPSPAISHAKVLSRSESNSSINSTKKKCQPKSHSSDDDTKSCMTRSSSNGSAKRKSSLEKRKQLPPGDFVIDMLKDELEKEKASVRSLQGQKEAIAKDLDYFCSLVDQVTEEKDSFKRKYEQEKLKNEELKKSLQLTGVASPKGESQLKLELEAAQQQITENQYIYYNNVQIKNEESNKLRHDLKQATRQIQVLRKTMEQMLRADGKDFDDNFFEQEPTRKSDGGEKYLLLQTGYHPESPLLHNTRPTTNPPSPTPCYSSTTMTEERYAMSSHDEDEDLLSTTSKDSGSSGYRPLRNQQYDFLKYDVKDDDPNTTMAKRKSADFSKKIAMSRRRKDQLEEMLGEVDSQLNKVKQKIRPC